jgi:hypothetical protein
MNMTSTQMAGIRVPFCTTLGKELETRSPVYDDRSARTSPPLAPPPPHPLSGTHIAQLGRRAAAAMFPGACHASSCQLPGLARLLPVPADPIESFVLRIQTPE